jgi:PleD family two-component response regulator
MMARGVDSDLSRFERTVRVLVADDDPVNRELIVEVCQSEGFDAVGVETGDQALAGAQAGGYDLLLLDAAMPGMNGLEVCRALKSTPETAFIPVIIVTASLEDAVRDRATELGAAAFVTKPFRVFELSQRMRAAVRGTAREGEPPTAPHIRLRRQRADALSALPPPSALRARLQREIDVCARDEKPVVCAVLRLENDGQLSATLGRGATDALLGGAVVELNRNLDDGMVRGDVDELVIVLAEEKLPMLATIAAHLASEGRMGTGVALGVDVCFRWGATIADPNESDPETLIAAAHAALEKAQRAGEPGGIERTLSTPIG